MAQQLKRWESPRKPGRNQKGRGGAARQRQLKKQHKQFLKQLKAQARANAPEKNKVKAREKPQQNGDVQSSKDRQSPSLYFKTDNSRVRRKKGSEIAISDPFFLPIFAARNGAFQAKSLFFNEPKF